MAKIHLYHVILGGDMSQVSRLENDHMRLGWDARKRRLIAVYVANKIFFLLQNRGKLSFPFALRCTRTCHTLGLTPVSRLHIGGLWVSCSWHISWTSSRLDPSLTPSIALDFLYFFLGISVLNTSVLNV